MNQAAKTITIENEFFFLQICLDPFNKRIRIDDYRGNTFLLLQKAEQMAHDHHAEKLIFKVRREHLFCFIEKGFQIEAVADGYFMGSDAYFCVKYFSPERRKNEYWITEDRIIDEIHKGKHSKEKVLPREYQIKRADEKNADELAALYRHVFQIYPTPLHDPNYVKKTMNDGTIYLFFSYDGKIVSAASAETNDVYKNAELTDCATLPEHRKYGLMKILLQDLERELAKQGIYCCYSIARALSFGMNAVLLQLGYSYRGRLLNNCYIYDKLEDMNLWVKNLSK